MPTADELYQQAEALKDAGKNEEAIAQLLELLKIEETHCLSHLALAVLYGKVGRQDEAIEHGRRACVLEPNDPFSFTALSVTYRRAFQGTQNPEYIQLAETAMARSQTLQGQA